MTIEANIGLPGTGKSLHAVGKHILPALRDERMVVTNIPLNMRELRIQVGEFVDPLVHVIKDNEDTGELAFSKIEHFSHYDHWRKGGDKGQGPLFVIDECHAPFADCVGLKANEHPIVRWMAKHRHKGCDVLLCTQTEKGIPSAIRGRVERFNKFIRKGFMGADNSYRMNVYDTNGVKLPVHDDGKYNPEWFKLYQSHVPGAVEVRAKTRSIFHAPQFKFIAVMAVLFIAFLAWMGVPKIPGVKNDEKPAQAAAPAAVSAEPDSKSNPAVPVMAVADEVAKINAQVELLRAQRTLERVQAGCDDATAPSAGMVTALATAPMARAKPDCDGSKAIRFMHDQVGVRITGHMLLNAQPVYWLEMHRGGHVWLEKGHDLEPYGFTLMPVSECLAWLKGERGNYRITCDGPNMIGYEDAVPLKKQEQHPAPEKKRLVKIERQGNTTTMMMVE